MALRDGQASQSGPHVITGAGMLKYGYWRKPDEEFIEDPELEAVEASAAGSLGSLFATKCWTSARPVFALLLGAGPDTDALFVRFESLSE